MKRLQNLKPYAIDSPSTLAPAEIVEVEESEDVDRLIAAGILGDVDASTEEQSETKKVVGETGPELINADGQTVQPHRKKKA